jgi:hypothetical protein
MGEATQTITPQPSSVIAPAIRASMSRAAMMLARRSAIKATKRQFQAQGLKQRYMAHRIIAAAAKEYLAGHRAELIAEAKEIVERWPADGRFGKRGELPS